MPNRIMFSTTPEDLKTKIYGDNSGTSTAIKVASDGSVSVTGTVGIAGDVTFTATDLDIRNLSYTQDAVSIYGYDGSAYQRIKTAADGSVSVTGTVGIAGDVTVNATDLDIRNLSYTQDLIAIGGRRLIESSDTTTIVNQSTGGVTFTTDTSICSEASFFIKNTGSNPIGINLEVSPTDDASYFVDDGAATVTVAPNSTAIITPASYGKFTRVNYSASAGAVTAELYFVGMI